MSERGAQSGRAAAEETPRRIRSAQSAARSGRLTDLVEVAEDAVAHLPPRGQVLEGFGRSLDLITMERGVRDMGGSQLGALERGGPQPRGHLLARVLALLDRALCVHSEPLRVLLPRRAQRGVAAELLLDVVGALAVA